MANAAGVVLIDGGLILLRKPTNGFGGYEWTFSKGTADEGETPEETAVRETLEETGYECTLGKKIGDFAGSTSITTMFLATPGAKVAEHSWETERIDWFSAEEAKRAISTTPNSTGRKRDLAILAAALIAVGG
jgi:8-oxo-dGTP diphosphatase